MIALKDTVDQPCAAFQPKRVFALHLISSVAEVHPDQGHSTAVVNSLHASFRIH